MDLTICDAICLPQASIPRQCDRCVQYLNIFQSLAESHKKNCGSGIAIIAHGTQQKLNRYSTLYDEKNIFVYGYSIIVVHWSYKTNQSDSTLT